MHEAPHTAHRFVTIGRSPSTDLFAISNISGEMIGSAIGFFFILVFTIEQIRLVVSYLSDVLCAHRASEIHLSCLYCTH